MDCCSKYPEYRHPLIGGPAIGGVGVVGSVDGGGGTGAGGPQNGSYYSHAHPSIRYHQQSMYRLNSPGPGGFNGIGPPVAAGAVGPPTTPGHYPNYERYGSFSNLPPSSYVYSATGFGYGNLSGREVSGYYGQYEGLARSEVGGFSSYHNYRGLHDAAAAAAAAGVHGPRTTGYHIYPPHPGRELYPSPSPGGFHSHPGGPPPSHHPHHHHHPHHNNPQHNHLHHYSASKDSFMSQMSDLSSDPRGGVNDGNSFNSDITTAPPPINGGGPTNGMINGGGTLSHGNYPGIGATYQRTDSAHESGTGGQQHHHHSQQNGPHGMHQIATGFSYGLKDSKLRRPVREKDKCFAKMSLTSRRMECATPLDTSPRFERADTPFTPHPHSVKSSPTNIPPRLPSSYMLPNQPNGNSSPFPNSPNSWTQQCSPRPTPRKRSYSPRPQPSPSAAAQLAPSKNRVLECDFIPCKKSRKKIKTEHAESSYEIREEIKNITPLPGFQQAFGSTEIGRFSETFLNTPESPYEQVYESEADTLSPQPWETGDSLEGPHLNLHIGASVQPVYPENHRSMDSPVDGSYFSGIRCNY